MQANNANPDQTMAKLLRDRPNPNPYAHAHAGYHLSREAQIVLVSMVTVEIVMFLIHHMIGPELDELTARLRIIMGVLALVAQVLGWI